jgi:hypothetical protein
MTDFLSRQRSRPVTTHMTTARWMSLPPVRVRIDQLYACQDVVCTEAVLAAVTDCRKSWCGDPYPHVVRVRGEMIVEDGHTRVVAAEKRGDATILVRILGDAQLAGFCTVASVVGEVEGLLKDPVALFGAGMGLDEFWVAEDAAEDVDRMLGIVEEFPGEVVEDPGKEGVVGVAVEDASVAQSLGRMEELVGMLEGLQPGAEATGMIGQPVEEGSRRPIGKVPAKRLRIRA